MQVGIPAVPVSPAYSLLAEDHAQLRYILELVRPGLVYAADGARFRDLPAHEPAVRTGAGQSVGDGVAAVVDAHSTPTKPVCIDLDEVVDLHDRCRAALQRGRQLWGAAAYAEYVRRLQRRPTADRLSPSLLETLSIVAYRQPVARAEVER